MLRTSVRRSFATGSAASLFPNVSSTTFDSTHKVFNQSQPMTDINFFASSPRYVSAVRAISALAGNNTQSRTSKHPSDAEEDATAGRTSNHLQRCDDYGQLVGSSEMLRLAELANKNPPTFSAFDRYGRRGGSGTAEFHPSYHHLMSAAIANEVPSLAWTEPPATGAVVARCVLAGLHYQLEQGTSCPLTMTFAGVAPLKRAAVVAKVRGGAAAERELAAWVAKLTTGIYDSSDAHISLKKGATIGMSMTEKQGGSDVRSNTTVATPITTGSTSTTCTTGGAASSSPAYYTLRGHKWFTSAPMCDAFLTLAYVKATKPQNNANDESEEGGGGGGLSCFLVPRWLTPDEPNRGLQFQRLKGKLGDTANASSEVEYRDAVGMLVGEVGKGVKTIIEMVNLTRLDCLNGSAALMQRAALEAVNHAQGRAAFGAKLVEQPLMRNVLCDLAIEAEAANAVAMRIARGFDYAIAAVSSPSPPSFSSSSSSSCVHNFASREANFARLAAAITKYAVCKRAPSVVYEALECLGGNGYTEDFPMARLFRQSPLNAIWEGSGNVIVLDVFRAIQRDGVAVAGLRHELARLAAADKRLRGAVKSVEDAFALPHDVQIAEGRRTVELLAKLLQAAALHPTLSLPSTNNPPNKAGEGGGSGSDVLPTNGEAKLSDVEVESVEELIYDTFVETRFGGSAGVRLDLIGTLPSKFVSNSIIDRITPKFSL